MTYAQQPQHVVIVGGGIGGLVTAYELQEGAKAEGLPLTWTLIDGANRLGGKIVTDQADGFTIEGGPDSFLSTKPWAADLCRRLGLGEELMGTNEARRGTYVLHGGKLHRFPEGLNLIVPTRIKPFLRSSLISWRGKLRMALDLVIPARTSQDDESVAGFVRRRLGQEVVDKLAEPLMAGIYAARPEQQSLQATFARFHEMEVKYRSLLRGARAQRPAPTTSTRPTSIFLTLRGGINRLSYALEEALAEGDIRTGTPVDRITQAPDGRYTAILRDTTTVEADAVVLATPTYIAADIIGSVSSPLAEALREIRYVSTATVSLGWRREDVPHPLDGTGLVISRHERRRIFGCTWMSSKFHHRAPDGFALIRCFMGGDGREEQIAYDDADLVRIAREELHSIMGISAEPVIARVFRWNRANPQYDVGHQARVSEIYRLRDRVAGLWLTGGAYEGVGLPDCTRHAQQTANSVLAYLRELHNQPIQHA